MGESTAVADLPEIDGYEVQREIARGGMGVVYKALQRQTGRPVAIKMILAAGRPGEAETLRFRLEAEAVASLDHPNIVQLLHPGEAEGVPYHVLEYVGGGTLEARKRELPSPPRQAARLVETLAEAMAHAHGRGVVHRDLKPNNVLMTDDEVPRPKIGDFGLARVVGSQRSGQSRTSLFGTLEYMSPEQAHGGSDLREIGPETDVWSLGVMLYEQLVGEYPFQGKDVPNFLDLICHAAPAPPRKLRPDIPRDLETICLKCLAKDPRARYETARELTEDLARFRLDEPIMARPAGLTERAYKWCRRNPTAAALIVAAALGAGLAAANRVEAGNAKVARAEARLADADRKQAEADARAVKATAKAEAARILAEKATAEADKKTAEAARATADAKAVAAEALADERRKQAEQNAYFNNITQAAREIAAGHPARAERLLADCPVGLRDWEWHHLRRRLNTERLRVRIDHDRLHYEGSVRIPLAFTPDGKRLAIAPDWWADLANLPADGPRRVDFDRHYHFPAFIYSFSPDGALAASAVDQDRNIVLWKARKIRWVWEETPYVELRRLVGHAEPVVATAFGADGKKLASLARDNVIRVWDVETGRELASLKLTAREPILIGSLAFSPDGKTVAALYWREVFLPDAAKNEKRRELVVWDLDAGQPRFPAASIEREAGTSADAYGSIGDDMVFSPDGREIAISTMDRAIRLIDAAGGAEGRSLAGHAERPGRLAYFPDGRRLVSGGQDRTLRIWDLSDDRRLPLVLLAHEKRVRAVAVGPDGKTVASTDGGEVKVWDADRPQGYIDLEAHPQGAVCYAISPDGTLLAVGGPDRTLRLWDPRTGALVAALEQPIPGEMRAAFPPMFPLTPRGHTLGVLSLAFGPDGKRLAVAVDKEVHIWDVATRELLLTFSRDDRQVTYVLFSPDGKRIVATDQQPLTLGLQLSVRDPDTGRPTVPTAMELDPFSSEPVFDPRTGHLFVHGTLGGKLGETRVIDIREWKVMTRKDGLVALAFDPDGRLGAAAVDLSATQNRQEAVDLRTGLIVSGDQSRLEVVDLRTGLVVSSVSFPERLAVHLAFNKGATRLAVLGRLNGVEEPSTLSLWDTASGREAMALAPETGSIWNSHFTPDGNLLVTSIGGGVLRIWNGTPLPDAPPMRLLVPPRVPGDATGP